MKFPEIKPHHIKQAGVSLAVGAMIAVVESKSALGAYHAQADHINGIQMAMVSALSALLAFVGFSLVGAFKDDMRPDVKARVKAVRIIAICFLILPISFFGSSVKLDRLHAEYAAYIASPLYATDQAFVADPSNMIGQNGMTEQERRLIAPTTAKLDILDGELWFAAFLLGLLNFAAEAFRIPAPITEAERAHIRAKEIAAKGQATRRANKAKRDAAKDRRENRERFGVVKGGKRDEQRSML